MLHRNSKGVSLTSEAKVTKVLKKSKVPVLTTPKVRKVARTVSLITLVQKELQLYKDRNDVYNGLINIVKRPEFLVACYEEIRGKPGNMTKGITKETLDGLTMN